MWAVRKRQLRQEGAGVGGSRECGGRGLGWSGGGRGHACSPAATATPQRARPARAAGAPRQPPTPPNPPLLKKPPELVENDEREYGNQPTNQPRTHAPVQPNRAPTFLSAEKEMNGRAGGTPAEEEAGRSVPSAAAPPDLVMVLGVMVLGAIVVAAADAGQEWGRMRGRGGGRRHAAPYGAAALGGGG